MTPELQATIDATISKAVREHNIVISTLTELQTCEAFKQAIACGDFQRLVAPHGAQQVVYIPFRREQELLAKIAQLEARLKEYTDHIDPELE